MGAGRNRRAARRSLADGRLALVATGLALVLVAAACSSGSDDVDATGEGGGSSGSPVEQVVGSPVEDVPSALDSMTASGLPDPLVEPSEVRSGGPPPDGIPPIDEPKFLGVDEVDFLEDREPVLAVEVDGEARAYPVQIMIWHEIVNDTIAEEPVTVTYCPLCNTAVGFERTVGDRVLSFGTSGSLYQSSLVMYDRQTESLWTHVDGRSIAGVLTGTDLERIPVQTIAWGDWRDAHADGVVLSRDTGASRDYGRNPYPGYDDIAEDPFLFDGDLDDRLPAKQRVIGTGDAAGDPVAVPLEAVLEAGVVETDVDGDPVVIWAVPGTASALDAGEVADGRDVGATGVFLAELDGDALEFRRDDDAFVDTGTGSRWNVLGTATAGPLVGRTLDRVEHVDTFWFAWAAFSPDTRLEQ